jgi:CheY-like chemotaxis protein
MISLRIAIADDEPSILADLEETLIELGHRVVLAAADGLSLVTGCVKELPDLVISDCRMPGLHGSDVAERLAREQPVPFVIVSAYCLDPQGLEGVHATIRKPLVEEDLQQAIETALESFSS